MPVYLKWGLMLFVLLWLAVGWNYTRIVKLEKYPHVAADGAIYLARRDPLAMKTGHEPFRPARTKSSMWPGWLSLPQGSYAATAGGGDQSTQSTTLPPNPHALLSPWGKSYNQYTQVDALLFMDSKAAMELFDQQARAGGMKCGSVDESNGSIFVMNMEREIPYYHLQVELTPVIWPSRECTHASILLYSKIE